MVLPLIVAAAGMTGIAYFKGATDTFKKVMKPIPIGDASKLTVGHLLLLAAYAAGLLWLVNVGAGWLKKLF